MAFSAFFKLIRWKNLLLIAYVQILIYFLLFPKFNVQSELSIVQFVVLVSSILSICAAGYIINDLFDVEIDAINRPDRPLVKNKISIEGARKTYLFLNALGLILGIGLCMQTERPSLSALFIGTALLLYYYSKIYKSKLLIGNLMVSALIAIHILLLIFFGISENTIGSQGAISISLLKTTLYVLAGFAFMINLLREIIKDLEDLNGDFKLKLQTLPIVLGRDRTKTIVASLCLIPLGVLLVFMILFADYAKVMAIYLLVCLFIPLLYIMLKVLKASSKKEFFLLSQLLKLIMFLGMSFIIIYVKYSL